MIELTIEIDRTTETMAVDRRPTSPFCIVRGVEVGAVLQPGTAEQLVAMARSRTLSREESDTILAQLALYAAEGSASHCELLVRMTYELPFARAAIGRILFNEDDAEDALQETMLGITRSIHSFQYRASFTTWASAIARNKATDVLRRRKRLTTDTTAPEDVPEQERFSSQLADRVDLQALMSAMPPKLGQVVRLRDVDNLTYQEIADVLDLKLNTVRSRLARGRAHAMALLEERR